ncbi:hypothetical protein Tco_1541247 [Tanacetum coccineum]
MTINSPLRLVFLPLSRCDTRHIDGIRLTKPKPNYYYRPISKPANVNVEASTLQPKEKEEPSVRHPNNKDKDVLDLQEFDIVSLQNSFDAIMEKDKKIEVNNKTWKASNDVGSIMDDSDSEEVDNVFKEDNGKPMDDLVNNAHKKVEAPPKKAHWKTRIWSGRKADSPKRNVAFSSEMNFPYFDRDDIEEVEHENAYSKKGSLSYGYWHFL